MDLTKIQISEAELKEQIPILVAIPSLLTTVYDGECLNILRLLGDMISAIALVSKGYKAISPFLDKVIESDSKQIELLDMVLKSDDKLIKWQWLEELKVEGKIDAPPEMVCKKCNGLGYIEHKYHGSLDLGTVKQPCPECSMKRPALEDKSEELPDDMEDVEVSRTTVKYKVGDIVYMPPYKLWGIIISDSGEHVDIRDWWGNVEPYKKSRLTQPYNGIGEDMDAVIKASLYRGHIIGDEKCPKCLTPNYTPIRCACGGLIHRYIDGRCHSFMCDRCKSTKPNYSEPELRNAIDEIIFVIENEIKP